MHMRAVVTLLAVAAFSPLVTASGDFATQLLSKLLAMPGDTLALTQPVVPPVATCSMTAQIQTGDTAASLASKYGLALNLLSTLNVGLDGSQPLTAGKSICIGGANAACNSPLNGNMQCPDAFSSLVADTRGLSLGTPLLALLSAQPDLYQLYQDPQTSPMVATIGGAQSLIMTIPTVTAAVTSIRGNPGHPFIDLWAASGAKTPMVISIIPARFRDGGALITYVPGTTIIGNQLDLFPLVQSIWSNPLGWLGLMGDKASSKLQRRARRSKKATVGRKLLSTRLLLQSANPPAGSAYYQSPSWYG